MFGLQPPWGPFPWYRLSLQFGWIVQGEQPDSFPAVQTRLPDWTFLASHKARCGSCFADPEGAVAEVKGEGLIKTTGRVYRQDYVVFLRAARGKIAFLREYFDPVRAATALDTPILGLKWSSKNVEVVAEMAWLPQSCWRCSLVSLHWAWIHESPRQCPVKTTLGFHLAAPPFSWMHCNRDYWIWVAAGDSEGISSRDSAWRNRLAFRSSDDLVWGVRHSLVVLAEPHVLRVPIEAGLTPQPMISETSPLALKTPHWALTPVSVEKVPQLMLVAI
jgi:hypothetical protein